MSSVSVNVSVFPMTIFWVEWTITHLKKKQIIAQTVKNKLGLYYSKVFFFYDECNKNAKFTLAIYSEEKKVKKKKKSKEK